MVSFDGRERERDRERQKQRQRQRERSNRANCTYKIVVEMYIATVLLQASTQSIRNKHFVHTIFDFFAPEFCTCYVVCVQLYLSKCAIMVLYVLYVCAVCAYVRIQAGNQREEALLSKEAFNAEMGGVLFSLTADGAAAARARELAGVPLIAAELRKRWCVFWRGARVGGATAAISFLLCKERSRAGGGARTARILLLCKEPVALAV